MDAHGVSNSNVPSADFLGEAPDWNYIMRREMQEIVNGLYLGPYSVAVKSKCKYLEDHGVTHIICIRQEIESHIIQPHFVSKFQYLILNIADCVTENIIQHFPRVRAFIDECTLNGGKVLVHGNAGISRSSAVVIGYIMEKYGLTYTETFNLVQQRRFCINPNEGFVQQLREYEPIYRAKQTHFLRETSMWKRKRECTDDTSE